MIPLRTTLALPILLLVACGSTTPSPPPTAEQREFAECRAEARASPEMREIGRESWMNNTTNQARIQNERAETEARLFADCLRRRGISRGGGVEPVRRRNAI
jgi:membrane-bound lytic murein transglycosylase B